MENKSLKVLPKLEDLHHDIQQAFKNDGLNLLLNQEPRPEWLKKHPTVTKKVNGQYVPSEYLPIEKVEFLLTKIFQEWRVEVLHYQALFQSVSVSVRLHYKNPVTGEWSFHDGVGAAPVQVDQGSSAADLSKIKSGAIQMGLPAAKSYAIKDAAEHLGKLFGRDVNRTDTAIFTPSYAKETMWTKQPELNGASKNN
jgi:hypothetical protein